MLGHKMSEGLLAGKTAIVTGAGRGIGRGIAEALASCGANVVVVDRDAVAAESVSKAIAGRWKVADVKNADDVSSAVEFARDTFGRIDVVVNNAGITKFVDLFDVSNEFWDEVIDVNLRSMFYFTREAAAVMRQDKVAGSIVNIASIAAKGYRHTSSVAYAASKGGVIGLTRSSAMQLAQYGIRVNAVCPGITLTEMAADWLDKHPERIDEIPLRRPNSTEQIGDAVAFLASDAAGTITAQSWNVDGGLTID